MGRTVVQEKLKFIKDNISDKSKIYLMLRYLEDVEKVLSRRTNINKFLILNGEKKYLAEWARIYNIDPWTISQRLKYGWSVMDAITKPIRKKI